MNEARKTRVVRPETLAPDVGSDYPEPFAALCAVREKRRLGDPAGLTQFGVNHVRLAPGMASSQRHWHTPEDELVYVLEGELTLICDAGETLLTAGMAVGFAAGNGDGHQLVNRSDREAVYLEIGGRTPQDEVHYPDIDLHYSAEPGRCGYVHKDGTPY